MKNSRIHIIFATVLLMFLIFGVVSTLTLDSDFGKIEVQTVSITENEIELSGLLYKPKSAQVDNPAPGIVLAHGISGSKEMMSSIGLELARRDFVSLCLDLYGHGKSQGTVEDGRRDPSFGVYSAIQYLKSKSFVNNSALGLIGHSLGAGAARAASFQDTQINALVLIAGGLGDVAQGQQYGSLNSTYPRNLLVVVGKYDILFELTPLATRELPAIFGTHEEVTQGVLYGNFSSKTARKFVVPLTTHLFEPTDPVVVSESVDWMEKAIGVGESGEGKASAGFFYPQRETSIAVALIGLIGMTFLSFFPIGDFVQAKFQKNRKESEKALFGSGRLYSVWAVVNLTMFVPMFAVGSLVAFPPLVFGSSVAWWMLGSGLVGLLILAKFSKRFLGKRIAIRQKLIGVFTKEGLILAGVSFLILFSITIVLAVFFNFGFRIISPILRDISSMNRAIVFPLFLPFFLPYFIAESMFLHELAQWTPREQENWNGLRNYFTTVFAKIAPFMFLLFLQYSVKISFDIWLLPSFAGFLLEFLWLIVPIFTIACSFSWWFYRRTGNALSSALLNALLMSWIASVVFPF
ncbi:MAG TPA: alpha/beta fold hydrolase [Candidatus Bathyarchaeia archaeon]